jgi:hypothetical protein
MKFFCANSIFPNSNALSPRICLLDTIYEDDEEVEEEEFVEE